MYPRRMTRDFFRPSDVLGAVMEVSPEVPGSEIYRYTNRKNEPVAEVFGGKRAKPDWHFRFPNEERREEKIKEWIENQKARAVRAKEGRAEHNSGHTLKVGDALHASWGYDQTNADFYQIVGVPSKCFVMARKIGYKTVRTETAATYVVPVKDSFKDDEAKRYKAGPDNHISINSYMSPGKTGWEEEHYVTHWAYGH